MENYFVAARKGAEFIGRILDSMIDILVSPESVSKDIAEERYKYFSLNGKDIYYQYFLLAGHRVLKTNNKHWTKIGRMPLVVIVVLTTMVFFLSIATTVPTS